ncbi:MAG TPA: hypothetical protein PK907_11355 [Candidatus Sabulitectum sp.]|nr:hypothetical protein [Candidatus Sabulitectum sp.]HPF33600.1 hypothetical protein [Candidatus Sabulitectum sp.]
MRTAAVILLAASCAFAVSFQEYAQVNVVSDSLTYGDGLRKDVTAGFRVQGSNWDITLNEDWVTAGENPVLERFYASRLESRLEGRVRFGGFTLNPEFQYDMDLDSAAIVYPLSLGEGYRNSALQPAMTLVYEIPGVLEVSGTGRYWVRDVAALDSDLDAQWSEMRYGGQALWHTPVGACISVGGVSHQTVLDEYGYDESWSRLDVAAGYTPTNFPVMTFITAEAEYSAYTGEDYTGMALPDRFTARLRGVQSIARNVAFNVSFSQAADIYEDQTALGPFQAACRTRFKFAGWGDVPSSVTLSGQFTESYVTTQLGEIEGRISLVSGLSALVTGKLWYGPSSVENTGGYRTREIIGGGLEYRMDNGLNTFFLYEREGSNLDPDQVWSRIRGGIGFYPAQH